MKIYYFYWFINNIEKMEQDSMLVVESQIYSGIDALKHNCI